MIRQGNEKAELLYEAQAYQVAKGIGQLAPALKGNVDAIILTGGMAHSKMLTDWITDYIDFLGPVRIMPGEMELEALVYGALRILQGQEKQYLQGCPLWVKPDILWYHMRNGG